ncbi:L-selectin-like [Callorhinchus milii]|uniref:L-selectin-like n=1 Tax=Callorhinchus milii TaxID=7868 RepID=UPI001C3FF45F|nr:L-selectin-like [Callorhinchus milii]
MACIHPIAEFSYRSKCTFQCVLGFMLKGLEELECTSSGRWSAQTPTCEDVICQPLMIPTNGTMNCSYLIENLSYSSTCAFSCLKGFSLKGPTFLHCNDHGIWNEPTPSCELITLSWVDKLRNIGMITLAVVSLLFLILIIWIILMWRRKVKKEKVSPSRRKSLRETSTV